MGGRSFYVSFRVASMLATRFAALPRYDVTLEGKDPRISRFTKTLCYHYYYHVMVLHVACLKYSVT